MGAQPRYTALDNAGETFQRRGGAHMGFSERMRTILTRIELRWTVTNQPVYDSQPFIVVQGTIGACPFKIDRVVKKYSLSNLYTPVEMN